MNDPISEMIIRIKNASDARKPDAQVSYSKIKHAIAELLKREGYISGFEMHGTDPKKSVVLSLQYSEVGTPRVQGVRRRSHLSRREYVGVGDIRTVKSGRGTLVLSTPQGIVTGAQARKNRVGGEVLFEIW